MGHYANIALICALMGKLGPDRPLQDALIRQGLVRSLSRSASSSIYAENTLMFNGCIHIIGGCILRTPGPRVSAEAIGNGLLDAILKYAWTPSAHRNAITDLVATLTRALVYFSVLSQLQVSIERLDGQLNADTFKDTPFSAAWEDFWHVTEERLDLMNSYRTKSFPLLRACDNVECGTIGNKSEFRRCSGCRTSNYCSAACQARHWRHGGHRDSCTFMRASQGILSTRDRSFLRLLLHAYYLQYQNDILHEYLKFWRHFPDDEIILDVDLSRGDGPFHLSFMATEDLAKKWPRGADYVAHAGNSGGRMQLHVLRVAFGNETHEWLFPLRSATSEIFDGVRQIALEPRDVEGEDAEEDDRQRIQGLIDLQVLETHNTGFWICSESL
ncbi:MYND-type domain-containing protein [Mycena sanguinolenta]|uniref:MYND-type domain-containing protein n=1 Tax=Mycena sanguinolenta TaxID=230812 RepID=A0A8H7DMK6_9AGAR|nr:MYND-type domain-containing protein [Mycena sanguinolenta]